MAKDKTLGIMATYPARADVCCNTINTLAEQFTLFVVVLNEYSEVPDDFPQFKTIKYLIPDQDYKDVGKFIIPVEGYDYVFTCDDDILYPSDYVKTMIQHYQTIPIEKKCLGLHGSRYDKEYDGTTSTSNVQPFHSVYYFYELVDQLGTGTTMTKPEFFPSLEYMRSSQKFVDIRFAQFCFENDIAMVLTPRKKDWLQQQAIENGIVRTFSRPMRYKFLDEIRFFAGIHKDALDNIRLINEVNKKNGPYGIDNLYQRLTYLLEKLIVTPTKKVRLKTRNFRRKIKYAAGLRK